METVRRKKRRSRRAKMMAATTTTTAPTGAGESKDGAMGISGKAAAGVKFKENDAKDLFDAQLISQHEEEENSWEESHSR